MHPVPKTGFKKLPTPEIIKLRNKQKLYFSGIPYPQKIYTKKAVFYTKQAISDPTKILFANVLYRNNISLKLLTEFFTVSFKKAKR